MLTIDDPPPPLESVDPVLAEHFRLVANKKHPTVKTINIEKGVIHIRLRTGRWIHRKLAV